jgi:uncharacterized protein YoxC
MAVATREMLMNNEETERTMQFILQQQAQSTVKVDRLAEKVDKIAENVDRLEKNVDKLVENVDKLVENVDRLAEKVDLLAVNTNKLANAQLKYEVRTGRLEESFLILVQLAQSTDERLDNVDRKMNEFSEGRNGNP